MSEAAMGEATQVTEAVETAGKQFQSKPEKTEATPDFSKMTGAEAKAYVEAQKKKESPVKEAVKSAAEKLKPKGTVEETPVQEAAREVLRKMKLLDKDGTEIEVDEDEVKKTYLQRREHQRAANQILQEGKAARKQAEEFIAMMKDPEKFFEVAKKLGHNDRELAEKRLAKYLEEEMMDPREKELRDAKAKVEQYELEKKQEKERIEAQRHEALKAKYAKQYTEEFTTSLKKYDLPADKDTVAMMASYIKRTAQIGFKMTTDEAAQLVKEDLQNKYRKVVQSADGKLLMELLGDEVANKIRKFDTERLKSPEQNLRTPEQQGQPRERKVPHKRMSPKEWREFNRK